MSSTLNPKATLSSSSASAKISASLDAAWNSSLGGGIVVVGTGVAVVVVDIVDNTAALLSWAISVVVVVAVVVVVVGLIVVVAVVAVVVVVVVVAVVGEQGVVSGTHVSTSVTLCMAHALHQPVCDKATI